MSRNTVKRPAKEASVPQEQGPKRRRSASTLPQQLDGDACREAISFLVHSPDEASVLQKMKMTFQHRQDLVHDPQRTADVFKTFPRFLDVKGLVSFAFILFSTPVFNLQCFAQLDVKDALIGHLGLLTVFCFQRSLI